MDTTTGNAESGGYTVPTVPSGPVVQRRVRTPLQEAVYEAGKARGITSQRRFGPLIGLTPQGLNYLMRLDAKRPPLTTGHVRSIIDVNLAELVDMVTTKLGHRVPSQELLGQLPWQGPNLHSPDPVVRRRAQRAREECPRPESNWDLGPSEGPSSSPTRLILQGVRAANG